MQGGRTLVVAAHNPTTHDPRLELGKLPPNERAGVLAPHLALTTGTPIIPSLVEFDIQQEHPGWNNEDRLDLPLIVGPKKLHIGFGEGIVPDPSDISIYQELTNDLGKSGLAERDRWVKVRAMLRECGAQVMRSLHDTQIY